MAKNRVDFIVGAKDEASKKLGKIQGSFSSMGKAAAGLAAIWGGARIASGIGQLVKLSAESEKMQKGFSNMAASAGRDWKMILRGLEDVSAGTISQMELMKNASRAVTLGIPVDQLTGMMEIARAASVAMGESVEFMFQSIVTGTARQSKLILDNLGIIVDQERIYAEETVRLGREITEAEKKQAFLNSVLVSGQKIITDIGDATENAASKYERFAATTENLRVASGKLLSELEAQTNVVNLLSKSMQLLTQVMESGGPLDWLDDERDKLEATRLGWELKSAVLWGNVEAQTEIIAKLKELGLLQEQIAEQGLFTENFDVPLPPVFEEIESSIDHIIAGVTVWRQETEKIPPVLMTTEAWLKKLANAEKELLKVSTGVTENNEKLAMWLGGPIASGMGGVVHDMIMLGKSTMTVGAFMRQVVAQLLAAVVQATILAGIMALIRGGGFGGFFGGFLGFHAGGMIPKAHDGIFANDEGLILAQSGEAVLSRRATQAIGGRSAIDFINNNNQLPPSSNQGQSSHTTVFQFNGDVYDADALVLKIEEMAELGASKIQLEDRVYNV